MPRTIDQIEESQSSKEVTANELFAAGIPALGFGKRGSTSVALTLEIYGGVILIADVPTLIGNYTATLTASSTNYIRMNSDGTFTVTTSAPSGWPGPLTSGAVAILDVATDTGAVIDGSLHDWRVTGSGGVTFASVLAALAIDGWAWSVVGGHPRLTITKSGESTVLDFA